MGRIGGLGFSRGRTAAALLLSAAWLAAQEPIPAGLARGIALLEEGRYEEAAGILGEAHRQEPGNLRVAIATLDAEQLVQLSNDDGECQANDEPLEDGLGDEIGHEAEADEAAQDRQYAGDEGEDDGEGQKAGVVSGDSDHRRLS